MWSIFQAGVVVVGVGLLIGCKEPRQTVVIRADGPPAVAERVEEVLEENPELVESVLGKKYIVRIIPPERGVDYKMQIIRPDADIDFKMQIINPGAAGLPEGLAEKLAEAIREKMQAESDKE